METTNDSLGPVTPHKSSVFMGDESNRKKIIATVFGFLFLAASLGVGVLLTQKTHQTGVNAAGANLTFSLNTNTIKPGDQFVAAVAMDTNGLAVTGLDLKVNYNSTALTATSIQPGTLLPYVFIGGTIANGQARIVLGCPIDSVPHPVTGTGLVATINFVANTVSSTSLTFDPTTKVSASGQTTNQIGTITPITVTVMNPTPTPSPSASPSPTPTKSPSPTPSASPSPSPTRSPSPTPSASPSPTPTKSPSPTPSASPSPTPTKSPSPSPSASPTQSPSPTPVKMGDVNRDGLVNIVDIGIIIDNYDLVPMLDPRADLNGDGIANIIDIGIVIDYYGT